MPWSISKQEGRYCVVKEGATEPVPGGCHSTRAQAIKHQRALYANESRVASMYAELDEITEEWVETEVAVPVTPATTQELVKVVIGNDHDALTASMLERLDSMSAKQAETQQALVAALHAIGTKNPTINVEAPKVDVAPPNITVEQPAITVEPPNVTIPVNVEAAKAPDVHLTMPSAQRSVKFTRDPLTDRVSSAEILEQ